MRKKAAEQWRNEVEKRWKTLERCMTSWQEYDMKDGTMAEGWKLGREPSRIVSD